MSKALGGIKVKEGENKGFLQQATPSGSDPSEQSPLS